jgi:3-hydroxypropanoate dehydrogenase
VRSPEAKAKLAPLMDEGNRQKTTEAPATAIIGMDLEFYEKLPKLFPHTDARSWFVGKPDHIRTTAMRNSSLQGAYLIMAARAIGLDCGPMSGFDNAGVDAAFFEGTSVKSNFIVNLGYGNHAVLKPRSPRLEFDEACRIV